jgi:hypothetical protein
VQRNLVIQRDGRYVSFRCRVGHAYSVAELITAKESALEARMWSAVFGFEELSALLSNLDDLGLAAHLAAGSGRDRATLARRQAARLRAIVQDDRPVVPSIWAMGGAGGPSSP